MRGMKESHIAIIICSESYASLSWCLEELVKTLECKKMNEQVVMHSTKWNPGKQVEGTGNQGQQSMESSREMGGSSC